MVLKAAGPIGIITAAIAISVGDGSLSSGHKLSSHPKRVTRLESAIPVRSQSLAEASEILKGLSSGLRERAEIDDEFEFLAGNGPAVQWSELPPDNSYRLVMVATRYHNLDSQLEIMSLHSLPSKDFREDVVTYFSQKIDRADQQTIESSILIPMSLTIQNGQASFDSQNLKKYSFRLSKDNSLVGPFGLREPLTNPTLTVAQRGILSPLAALLEGDAVFDEIQAGQYEVAVAGATYALEITPRTNELEQLVIEVGLREINSLTKISYVLVYEDNSF